MDKDTKDDLAVLTKLLQKIEKMTQLYQQSCNKNRKNDSAVST